MITPDNDLYEYRERPANDMTGTDLALFQELVEYLQKNASASVLGLQVLSQWPSKRMVEIVLKDVRTDVRDASEAKYGDLYRSRSLYRLLN